MAVPVATFHQTESEKLKVSLGVKLVPFRNEILEFRQTLRICMAGAIDLQGFAFCVASATL